MNALRGLNWRWGLLRGRGPALPVRLVGTRPATRPSSSSPDLDHTGLDHMGPAMSPVPVPTLAVAPDAWAFLAYDQPIDDPGTLAFQVAQLTVGMGELKRRLDAMEEDDERGQ